MEIRKLLFGTLCCLALGTSFVSCSDDDEPGFNDGGSKVELPGRRAFILYEGGQGANNAGIAFYAPNGDKEFIKDIYKTQNEKQLGSLGQSMIEYENNIYVVVSGSKYIAKLNSACVEESRYKIPVGEGDPRYIEAEDGFIYVTQYGGQVSKLDANTLKLVDTFKGGDNLEGIVECNGKLYVTNTYKGMYPNITYNKEVFVINSQTMELEQTLEVALNPNRLIEEEGKLFLISWGNYFDIGYAVQMIDPAANHAIVDLPVATLMGEGNDMIYFVNSVTDWNTLTAENTFFSYNVKTLTLNKNSFLKNAPAKLMTSSVYMISVDEETGDIYVGTTEIGPNANVTTGTIYRFDRNGNQKGEPFDAGGINPNTMLFLD